MARYYENELIHYGVKGMKWGVRRYQPYSYTGGSGKEVGLAKKLSKAGGSESRAERKARKKTNKAIIKQRKEDVKNRRTMTDEELNERINRIRKENELQNLTRQNVETSMSRELKNIGNKYKNRVEDDVVNATYNAAKVAGKFLLKKKIKQGETLSSMSKRAQANRAREDVETGKKLAKKYVSALEKKAKKRGTGPRAREDVELGKKLAKKYVSALEREAKKKEAQARAEEKRPGQSYVRDRLQLTTDKIGGRVRGIKKSDRAIDKISYAIGNKGAASDQRATSNFNARRAKRARTTLEKAWRTSKSKNNAEMAKYHDNVAKQDIAKRLQRGLFFDDTYFNTKHHRMSGRQTTKGRVMVDRYLTGGTVGAVKDVAYIAKKKKKQKTNSKKK